MRTVKAKFQRSGLLLPLMFTAATMTAQEPAQPPTREPPDVQQLRRVPQPPREAAVAPSLDQILARLGITRAAIEQRKRAATAPALPAAVEEPADVAEQKRAANEREPAQARSPTLNELLDMLRQQPGGAAKLERARQAGARIPQDAAIEIHRASSSASSSGPSVANVEVDPATEARAVPATTLKVTRGSPLQTVTGMGTLSAAAVFPYTINTYTTWGPFARLLSTNATMSPVGAVYDVKPYMSFGFNASSAGWYVLNVVASATGAETRRYSAGTYGLVQSFTKPATTGYHSYPILLNLGAGYHYFTWTNLDSWIYVSEISALKL